MPDRIIKRDGREVVYNEMKIADAKGVWALMGENSIKAAAIAPFCATHADLGVVRTKTAGQELIVNYTVLQV